MFCIGICDDDEGLCGELEKMLYDYGKENKLQMNIDIWYQGESLCRFLRENKKILDVLFLDIELLTTKGIEVGRFIREEQENMETAIVYISANSSYAMDLFRVQPTDFLIKPLDKIKVGNVMNRIQKISEVRKGIFEYFGSGYYFKVLYKDILYFSSQNKKVHLVLKDGQKEFNGKLKEIAKKIPGNFIQIHQSYLINFDYIEECSYESVKMKNGDTIPISRKVVPSMYQAILKETICACIRIDGQIIATGLGILDRDYIGIYAIHVKEEYRKHGYARQICTGLLKEGMKKGAQNAYLQVVEGNDNARALYRSLGFQQLYTYWFRVQPDENGNFPPEK